MRWFGWREWVLSGVGIGSFYAVLSWVGGFFRGLVSPSVGFLVCYILLQLKGQLFQILFMYVCANINNSGDKGIWDVN